MRKTKILGSIIGTMLTWGWPLAAHADDGGISNRDTAPVYSSGSVAGSLVWVIIALIIVIGLIVLFIKILSAKNRGWGVNRKLRTLGGVALGQNKSLQIVEIAGRLYIVGVGDEITLIDKIDDPEAAAAIIQQMEEQTAASWNPASVSEFWSKLRNRSGSSLQEPESWNSNAFQEILKDKLKRQADHKQKVESLLGETNQRDRSGEE